MLLRTGRRRPSPELAGELGLDSRECLVISVTRSALGIPAADLSGLLGLESRVEPRAAEQEYGLSAAFALVRQNGGGIQVFSRPSQGTKFEIYIPLCMDSDQPPPPATMQGWSSRLVLLAEDEVLVRELVHRILSENGFEVLDAADGLHALEVAEARNVPLDLVVTDVVMPGMSGIELARRITERYGEVPVLYMSGYLDRGEMKADLPAGAVLIHKPFKPDQFVRQVEELLQNRS